MSQSPKFTAILLLLHAGGLMATNYHVSPTGNDGNSGTSPAQAWRTVARVQQMAANLQAGDQVLFERGGTFPGQLTIPASGANNNPIVIGAYGTGPAPVISGAAPVTGWTLHQGNIWRASVAQPVKYVFIGGSPMTLARHPNTGWMNSGGGSTTSLTSGSITQPSGHWTGARLVVRSNNWCYESRDITAHTNSTLSFSPLQFNLGPYHWGFFICNSMAALDSPGEWFHDAASGQLYLWTPDGADPNTMPVEASIYDHGVLATWQRQHIRIQDIAFKGQREAGVRNDGAAFVTVTNCSFEHLYMGISSYGSNGQYTNNVLTDTYATGMLVQDNNSVVSNNILTNIAIRPGMGESAWGYFGIRLIGNDNVVRGNTLENVGYSAIFLKGDPLVERNHIRNAMAILNDGGGIHFDEVNGMVVRENIVLDLLGSLETTGSNFHTYYKICHGIYFGFRNIQNTIVEHNTVAFCQGSGIHVDHSMVSSGNQVLNNVLYGNQVQLSVSDYSNNVGTGAVAPFHVPAYNGNYSGNVLYSLDRDQLCMKQFHVYSANPVDFGTFSNNRYFNPWNELSIEVQNIVAGTRRYYTLERWQQQVGEDAGSTRSPLHLEAQRITQVLGTNLIANGNFDYNLSGWSGWPSQGALNRDLTYLDNGALRLQFSNPATSPNHWLRHDAMASMESGQWYALRFSLQSNMHGNLRTEVKTQAQFTGNSSVMERLIPFDGQRREVSIVFQGNVNDQVAARFVSHHTEGQYWIDNVQLHRVTVEAVDPLDEHVLHVNEGGTVLEVPLEGCWRDVNGELIDGSVSIPPHRSVVLVKDEDALCGLTTGMEDLADTIHPGQGLHPNPARAGDPVNFARSMEHETRAELYDSAGRFLTSKVLAPGQDMLVLPAELSPGMHTMLLRDRTGISHHRLLVQGN